MMPTCETVAGPSDSGWTVRTQIVLGACACAGAAAFLFAVDPSRHAVYPPCLFHRATGLYCAGCGATRALYALLHGRWLDAMHDNLLLVVALPFVLGFAGAYVLKAWREKAWPEATLDPGRLARAGTWIFFLLLAFMAVRNLPGPEFAWLRPPAS